MATQETFDDIMNEMLGEISDKYDKRPGSIIYNALAPVALKIASKNVEINEIENQVYPDTATGTRLEKKAAEEGLERKEPRAVQREAVFEPIIPPAGTRFFTTNGLFWILVNDNTVECETAGYAGNETKTGDNLVPTEYIEGLERAVLGEIKTFGANSEGDEELRKRLFDEYQNKKNNSNKAQIKSWAQEVQGVGDAKVISLWDGPNTVKVIIVDEEKKPAQPALVEEVQQYLDPLGYPGQGEGVADIGTLVTVIPASALDISVSVRVMTNEDINGIQEVFTTSLDNYRKQIVFVEDEVKYNYIGSLLMGIEGVEDYQELKLNGGTSNIAIPNESVPIFIVEVLPYE